MKVETIQEIKDFLMEKGCDKIYPSNLLLFANFIEQDRKKQLALCRVSNRRETLLAYEEWINEYKTMEEREKQVDKYLNK